ncbi:MAG TPA: dCMP deaminase family protein [Nitrospinaceae bacterium]|nr:dCMP deaminase family protein [Nitrospinaceae bacterium]
MSYLKTEENSLTSFGSRPTADEYFMAMAMLVATRSTCTRRQVGCVLIDSNNNILATGYNGVVRGQPHCNEGHPCPGAYSASGKDLDLCYAIHAEQNALIQCKDLTKVYACFCTTAPCVMCTKLFLNTTLTRMIYVESYPQSNISKSISKKTTILNGKLDWLKIPKERMKNVFNRATMAT